jgi:hypothetical protein
MKTQQRNGLTSYHLFFRQTSKYAFSSKHNFWVYRAENTLCKHLLDDGQEPFHHQVTYNLLPFVQLVAIALPVWEFPKENYKNKNLKNKQRTDQPDMEDGSIIFNR